MEDSLIDKLENVGCDREPFTADHAKCICRLTNKAAKRISELEEGLRRINTINDSPARFNGEIQAVLDRLIDTGDCAIRGRALLTKPEDASKAEGEK